MSTTGITKFSCIRSIDWEIWDERDFLEKLFSRFLEILSLFTWQVNTFKTRFFHGSREDFGFLHQDFMKLSIYKKIFFKN